jgi:hypothetical protein
MARSANRPTHHTADVGPFVCPAASAALFARRWRPHAAEWSSVGLTATACNPEPLHSRQCAASLRATLTAKPIATAEPAMDKAE